MEQNGNVTAQEHDPGPDVLRAWTDAERRNLFPVTADWIYCDHAGVAPICGPAAAAMQQVVRDFSRRGAVGYGDWMAQADAARATMARLVGVPPERLAFVENTSSGLSLAAAGLDWQAGDRVIMAAEEFPANAYPWLALADRGVRVEVWDPGNSDEEALAELDRMLAAGSPPRIITLSWVQFHTGRILPVRAVAERARHVDALCVVDGIQGLGMLPAAQDDWGVDLLAADGHKWLLGPEGCGIVGLSERALERFRPAMVGWHSVAAPMPFERLAFEWAPDARRFEPGTWNLAGMLGLAAAGSLLLSLGPEQIARQLRAAAETLRERLELPAPSWPTAGHVFVPLAGRLNRQTLLEQGIVAQVRGGRLRLSPHVYVGAAELETVARAVLELRSQSTQDP